MGEGEASDKGAEEGGIPIYVVNVVEITAAASQVMSNTYTDGKLFFF